MIEGQEGVSWPQWQAISRACEDHGIPALFRSDHYMNLDGRDPGRAALDAWATLNALAAITDTVRLGTLVSPASFRHPSVLAKQVVTADHVSGGRVELGLGAGWHEREHEAYGFPFATTGERVEVLEEQLFIVLGTWGDEPFDFDGPHYRMRGLEAHPKPVQRPHPPLIVGGLAGPRSAALAARYADEYNTVFPSLEDVRARRERIDRACGEAGRAPMPLSVMTAVVGGESAVDVSDRAHRRAAKEGGDGDALVAEPPHGWIVGTVEQCAERLIALRDAGVSRVMCQLLVHEDLEHIAVIGERLAPLVA
jgi:F420-dependent oxidoreductase-like protein